MTHSILGDMDIDDFRRHGHEIIDWIADYFEHPERYPVLSRSEPGDIKAQLPTNPPTHPEAMSDIMRDFDAIIMPGITHWNHPAFFAYFGITGSAPGVLAEFLTAALNVNGMLWKTSPAATELEEVTLDWLRQMIGLPDDFKGVIMDTASMSSMTAIAAARERLGLDIRRRGMAGRSDLPRLIVYTSAQAHSSIEKGAIVLGIGQENVRKIPVDDNFRMNVDALRQAITDDIAAGHLPLCVVATVGTTSTTSIDPVPEIAAICREHKLWLHVDGAYGGVAAIVPEMRHVLAGAEFADSVVINPHKWLFTPIDLSAFYIRDPHILRQAFSILPEYLKTAEQDSVTNYMDWGVQLGRRFRALKLWMVLRTFGAEGCAARLREHIRIAQTVAADIDADPDLERLAPTPFSTICFRVKPHDLTTGNDDIDVETYLNTLNEATLNAVNATGEVYMSHTKLNGRYTIRIAVGNIRTTEEHVRRAVALIKAHASRLDGEMRVGIESAK